MTLRSKLFVGLASMLIVLMIVGGLGLRTVSHYTSNLERGMLRNYENWASTRELRDEVAELNTQMLVYLRDSSPPKFAEFTDNFDRIDAILARLQMTEIEPEEKALTKSLQADWNALKSDTQIFAQKYTDPDEREQFYLQKISADQSSLMSTALELASLHFRGASLVSPESRDRARNVQYALVFFITFGVVLCAGFLLFVSRFILKPLEVMRTSVNEIVEGNLDFVIDPLRRDEFGDLAKAFNLMTTNLKEGREIERAKFSRTQKSTQLAIDSLRDAVFMLNCEGLVEVSNKTAQKEFGILPGSSILEAEKTWITDLWKRVCESKVAFFPRGFEAVQQVFIDNEEHFFLPNAVPIHEDRDSINGVTIVLADVTQLRRIDELRTDLVATVSHELRTPLTSIRMAVYILLGQRLGELNERQHDLVTTARNDCERLYNTIHDLLDIARIQSGGVRLDLTEKSPKELVHEATEHFDADFESAGMKLEIKPMESLPLVRVDSPRMRIVFSNLLNNSLRYCRSGNTVSIEATSTDDRLVQFMFRDNGPGIPSEYAESIFERFFRIPGTNHSGGAGLGLAIARQIVTAHGGTLSCEDTGEGGGAFFKIVLPAAQSHGDAPTTL